MKIYTLEITQPVKKRGILSVVPAEQDVVLEVDFDMTGLIHEIRIWSEYFGMAVPAHEAWLQNNCSYRMATIRTAIDERIHELRNPVKEYNNDDPNPAA